MSQQIQNTQIISCFFSDHNVMNYNAIMETKKQTGKHMELKNKLLGERCVTELKSETKMNGTANSILKFIAIVPISEIFEKYHINVLTVHLKDLDF